MVHTGIYATSAECIFKLGNGYNSTLVNEARINELCLQVENFCNDLGRQIFAVDATAWAALDAGKKYLLTEITSNFVGFFGNAVDQSGYNSQREAENLGNLCWARYIQGIGLLKNQETVTFIK